MYYIKVFKEDIIRRRKYEAVKNGRVRKLECLGCGRLVIFVLEFLYV